MKHIFYLSGDFIDLGREEVLSLFETKDSKLLNNLLIMDLNEDSKSLNNLVSRLPASDGNNIYRYVPRETLI